MRTTFTLLSAGALVATILVLASVDASANHPGGMNAMSIDMDEEATPANAATSLGTREFCRRINENNVMDADEDVVDGLKIDVTAKDVPAYSNNGTPGDPSDDTGGIIGYSFEINYSAANLTVDAHEFNTPGVNLLRTNPGSALLDVSDTVPDDNLDDNWLAAVLDNGYPATVPEQGSGVLHRITIVSEAAAVSGVYPLTLTSNVHLDAVGTAFSPDATYNAFVGINIACDDLDGDGIPNDQDTCPTTPGVPSNNGCPPPTTPIAPAVGGTAGLIDETSNGGSRIWHLAVMAATLVVLSTAGVLLTRKLATDRARR